jgi:probable F420-dependent oxidoreductase
MTRDFRFGIGLSATPSQTRWQDTARRAEDFGYDVLLVPDHLGAAAPFPALASAAEATSIRLGTYVLNAGFYKPALLARDVATLHDLTGGRIELGLGAGYVKEEFEAAELPFPSAGSRVNHLAHVTTYLREHLPSVPVLIAGSGDRIVGLAARHANIVGLTGHRPNSTTVYPLADRVEFVRAVAGDRFDDIELNLVITAMPHDKTGIPNLSVTRKHVPAEKDEDLLKLPSVLTGTSRDMADTLRHYRDTYGVTYITVHQNYMARFSEVIGWLR